MRKKFLSFLITVLIILGLCPLNTFALNFNGTASGSGDGSSTTASTGGYAVPDMLTKNSNRAVGYRVTLIDDAGNAQSSTIDVFRWDTYVADGRFYAGYYKFDAKYPKTYLKNNYSSMAFSTSDTTASVCHDTDIGTTLPNDTTGLPGWCTAGNVDNLIYHLWWIHVATLESNAWAVLFEPIFPVKLGGIYHSLTVTEIAVYGASRFGAGSNGGSSGNSNSWGFISNYTNWYLPNSLRLTSGYCGMAAGGYLGGRTTFANIIANGYGAAIAYSNCLDLYPDIVRWTYYQNSYDGFYVYVQTERAASLKIPTWTANNGQDDIIWYSASAQNNTVRGQTYNWILYVPRSNHNYEIGYYATHFYAYTAAGKYTAKGDGYEPPKITDIAVRQTDSGGFTVYAKAVAENNVSIPVWTENAGQDDLKWHQAYTENNTIDGILYNWQAYIPFSDHNNEIGEYILHFYVSNTYSEALYATKTSFTPEALAQLQVKSCQVWKSPMFEHENNMLGTSTGNSFSDYKYENGYPELGNTVWFSVYFPAEERECYVQQSVWIEGLGNTTRTGYFKNNEWYDVAFNSAQVDENRESYVVKARVDLLNNDGSIVKEGKEYTFYIPVRPTIKLKRVSAYSITGDLQAYTGENGDNGAVYYGQRIYSQYQFASDNNWTSYHNFRNFLYAWKSAGYWDYTYYESETGNADVFRNNVAISKSTPLMVTSRIGLYTVPDNSGSGENKLFYRTTGEWMNDTEHSHEEKSSYIPILKSDVELVAIGLADSDGYMVNPQKLEVGQQLTIRYYYRNNTDCTVYVNAYNRRHEQMDGVYAIPARQVISVIEGSLTVPNVRQFSIWGGVYLEGAGIGNTQYESNGQNNERMLECKVNMPLRLVGIAPNADYREGTDVITSYWLTNSSDGDYKPDSNISVRFVIFNSNGNLIITKEIKNVIVPAKDKNLCYFKWKVPSGLNSKSVTIQAMIVENGNYYNISSGSYRTTPFTINNTPDTQFEKAKPDGFSAPALPVTEQHYATWSEYTYENGLFKKVNYGIGIYTGNIHKIAPATGSTASQSGGVWSMKSGYGISLQSCCCMIGISGYKSPSSTASYTTPQYAYALFPEYGYKYSDGTVQALDSSVINSYRYWRFPQNKEYGNVHFVPLWYPDGKYTVKVVETDCWTPSGMITTTNVPAAVNISGNMYNDWYLTNK